METRNLNESGIVYFDPDDLIYKDHFPGNPVVPGSVIVHAFLKIIRKSEPEYGSVSINSFRFKTFIGPGEYSYTIRQDSGRIRCDLSDGDRVVVTGEFKR